MTGPFVAPTPGGPIQVRDGSQHTFNSATWMFEDAYAKHRHWHKLTYEDDKLENAVEEAAVGRKRSELTFAITRPRSCRG